MVQRVDDVMLMAYVDGEVDTESAREIEAAIARDPALAARARQFRDTAAFVRAAFAEALHAPVPDRLVAAASNAAVTHVAATGEAGRSASGRPAQNVVAFAPRRPLRYGPAVALAASVAAVALGVGLYNQFAGLSDRATRAEARSVTLAAEASAQRSRAETLEAQAQAQETRNAQLRGGLDQLNAQVASLTGALTDRWTGNVAVVYREMTTAQQREQRWLVDYPAETPTDDVSRQITERVGFDFRVPDLSAQGFRYQGTRLLSISQRPAAKVLYVSPDNELLGLVVGAQEGEDAPERAVQYDGVNMVVRRTSGHTYGVVSNLPQDRLRPIADRLLEGLR